MQNARGICACFFIAVLLVLTSGEGLTQRWKMRRYEVGVGLGTIQVFGDIGGSASLNNLFGLKDIKIDETRLGITSMARYKHSPWISIKGGLNMGFGSGTDANSRNDRGRAYKTILFEFSSHFEYFFLPEDKQYRSAGIYSRRGMVNNYSSLAGYVFGGFGVTYAISSHAETTIYPYDDYRSGANFVPVVPFGIGMKYILDGHSLLNLELGYRIALTDFVDGYKQTASSKYTDVYYFLTLSYNYRLKTTRRNIPAFLDRKYRRYGY